jgi:hypothetical protein
MAFNPFNWFRKHQKVIFAALTILCMIVFIFQFGAGDPFTKALALFGAGRSGGDVVTTLYGKKVYEGDLDRLQRQRKMANDFILVAVSRAQEKARTAILEKDLKDASADSPLAGLERILQNVRERYNQINSRFGDLRGAIPFFLRQISDDFRTLADIAERDKVKGDRARLELLDRASRILGFQRWQLEPPPEGQRQKLYFGGGVKMDDLLDFRIWLEQADQLGVKFTDDDVKKEIVAEAAGGEVFEGGDFERDALVRNFLRNHREFTNVTARELMSALRSEFRAVVAQGMLLGHEPGARAYRTRLGTMESPAVATPDEFLDYVRQQRSSLRVELLTIPVENYLSQVTAKPTAEELRLRYDRYKDQEPRPDSREPGFKEPRRITVECVWASTEDPYYRALARAKLASWPATVALAGSPLEMLAPLLADPIQKAYTDAVKDEPSWFDDPLLVGSTRGARGNRFHFTSAMQPVGLTSMFGSLAAGSPVNAAFGVTLNAFAVEARTSLRVNMTQLLAQAQPQNLLGAAALTIAATPPAPSERLLQPQLVAGLLDKIAEAALQANVTDLILELQKLRGRTNPSKEDLAKVTKMVKVFHLHHARTPGPRTQEDLVAALKKKQDVGLAPLRDAVARRAMLAGLSEDRQNLVFGEILFQGVGTYDARPLSDPEGGKETFLWWRPEDLPARDRPYAVVADLVDQAWRWEKARQLARQEAERLEERINKENWNAALAEKFLKEQKQGPVFELEGVSQLHPPREVLAGRATEYMPYRVPEEKSQYLEYEPVDLAKQLMVLKRPGQATVVTDRPAKHFYVAVLLERNEPSLADFRAIYAKTPLSDTLYQGFVEQQREEYRKAVLEQLRREAVKKGGELDKEGRFKIPEAVRKREGGGPREEE